MINPISGGLDKKSFKSTVEDFCRREELSLDFFETTGENDEEALRKSLLEKQPDLLLICGGDGTINLCVSCLQKADIDVISAIVPLGSANGLAKDLNIPEDPLAALRTILSGERKQLDVLQVNDYFSVHLSDLGFNAKLVKKFERSGSRGKWNYAKHFVSVLRQQSISEYSMLLNNEMLTFKAQMVAFANGRYYGTGAVINPQGRMDDGKFEVCIFRAYPWYALFGITWRFFTGNISSSPYVRIIPTQEALIFVNPEEVLQIDGEVKGHQSKIEVRLSGEPFDVIVPVHQSKRRM